MKDTNAIEQAIKEKCIKELNQVVDVFMNELETKIRGEYGTTNYYDFTPPNGKNYSFSCMGTQQVRSVLAKMLRNAHLDSMVALKSKELVAKLKLEI